MRASTESVLPGVIRRIRSASGLSQRAFAHLVGTSGPTIAAYETGTKEPRLSTVERMAATASWRVELRLVPSGRGAAQRARRERRSLALAAATAAVVQDDFARAQRLARENLAGAERQVGNNRARAWISEWYDVLARGPEAVRAVLLEPTDHGHDMRQMAPFAGLLSEDARRAALAAASALDDLDR